MDTTPFLCEPDDLSHKKPEPPDSWEKLEEDLDRCADAPDYEECAYFGKDASRCSSCVAGKEASCSKTAMRDIASRIRKLRGDGE